MFKQIPFGGTAVTLAMAAVCAGLPMSALAGTPIHETRPLAADGHLYVNNMAGLIEVVTWSRNEVELTGELGEDVEALDIDGGSNALEVHVRYPHKKGNIEETNLRVRVPVGASLDLEGVSADVSVDGVAGELIVKSVSGDISADIGSKKVHLNSVSGDITLTAPADDVNLHTVSGDIDATGVRGDLVAESVSGDLTLSGKRFKSMDLQSVSGDVSVEAESLTDSAKISAETLSGDIDLELGAVPDAELSMKTFSGSLDSDFGGDIGRDVRKFRQTLGKGRGEITLTSFSGDVSLSKR